MPVYCTKKIISHKFRERLFMIFERDKPYVLSIKYMKTVPTTTGGSGFGIQTKYSQYVDVEKTEYVKYYERRVSSHKEGNELIDRLSNGYCLHCRQIEKCKYFKLKTNTE